MSVIEQIKDMLGSKITDWQERSAKRIYFSINPQDIREVATLLFKDLGLRFAIATAQDTPQAVEVLYHFCLDKTGQIVSVRVLLQDKKNLQIDSLASLFKAAEWIEREMWELVGINFIGHPNLKHLLLIDDWPEGKFPLRHSE